MFQSEHKQVKELKYMLDTERERNSDLQQSLELQQSQLHSKVSEISILEMAYKYHVAEVKSLKEKVSSLWCWESPPIFMVDYSSIFPSNDRPIIDYFTPLLFII